MSFSSGLKKKLMSVSPVAQAPRASSPIDEALKRYRLKTLQRSLDPKGTDPSAKERLIRRLMLKQAENLAEQALLEANAPMQTAVPGSGLRDQAETGQAKGRATRTHNVRNEDREFGKAFKKKYDTARGGKIYGY